MFRRRSTAICVSLFGMVLVVLQAAKTDGWNVQTGPNAWADSVNLVPGLSRLITPADLPAPTGGVIGPQQPIPRPPGAMPKVPPGFAVNIYSESTDQPRQIRTAPNGDHFVVNQINGTIAVFRGIGPDGQALQRETFATGLNGPFGIGFYPLGDNPQWIYVGNNNAVIRFPYRNGDMRATGAAQTIVASLPPGGHDTRDLVFSNDGASMFVAVGSNSNINDPDQFPGEFHRANILEYTPTGQFIGVYASGLRNPVGLAIHPATGELWTTVNERDNSGDNLVPDFVTHLQKGGFYGWPYFYIGGNADARLNGAHPELRTKVIVPDVLLQAHGASLGVTFYTGSQFPAEYVNDAFVSEHGSWNRSVKAGHEIVRIPLEDGRSNGVYQDFLTGLVDSNGNFWGRPVGVTTAQDGSLLITDDLGWVIWRVSYVGRVGNPGRTRASK